MIEPLIGQMNQQVVALYHKGQYREAIDMAERVRDLSRQALGEDHPSYATSLNNLAGLYRAMGNYSAAEPLYRKASQKIGKAL